MFKEQVRAFASKELGFDLVAFTGPTLDHKYRQAYLSWLQKGFHGDMAYMEKSAPRLDAKLILPEVRSVIVLALNYYHEQPPIAELKATQGIVARYAYGRDYHKIIKKRLLKLEKYLEKIAPKSAKSRTEKAKSYVDTGPVLERAYAEQSGLGVIGKNSLLITREYGSWVFLAVLFTALEFEPDKPLANTDFSACGSCRRCIDACPTGAIVAPGVIDARKCISYLTIENKNSIPREYRSIIGNLKRIYGCDICQEVCPHNRFGKSKICKDRSLKEPRVAGDTISLQAIQKISTREQFIETFAGSPLTRAGLNGLRRNLNTLQK